MASAAAAAAVAPVVIQPTSMPGVLQWMQQLATGAELSYVAQNLPSISDR